MSYVWEVTYTRADGLAVAPILCMDADYAGMVAGYLLRPSGVSIMAVTVTRRPAMEGEINDR